MTSSECHPTTASGDAGFVKHGARYRKPPPRALLALFALLCLSLGLHGLPPQPAEAQSPERLVVLEMFGRSDCVICREHAAPALDALAAEYSSAGRPVAIFEHDTDNSSNLGMAERRRRWFRLLGVTRAPLPLLLLNGGLETAFGEEAGGAYEANYRAMIERALDEPPSAQVSALWAPTGATTLDVRMELRNTGAAIDPAAGAGVWIYVLEDKRVVHLSRYARGVGRLPLARSIAPNESIAVAGEVRVDAGTDLGAVRVLAVVERVREDGRWDVAQGAYAELDRDAPTPLPTATLEPTPESTSEPATATIHLPWTHR
jgi:thiol-disulfide isomerase/thioredoxin